MHFSASNAAATDISTQCLVLPVFKIHPQAPRQTPAFKQVDQALGGLLQRLLDNGDFPADTGSTLLLPEPQGIQAQRLLLIGLGDPENFSEPALRSAILAAFSAASKLAITEAAAAFTDPLLDDREPEWQARLCAENAVKASYRYTHGKSTAKESVTLASLTVLAAEGVATDRIDESLALGAGVGAGINFARELGNLPGNVLTPRYLAEQAVELGNNGALKVTVLGDDELEELGAGAILAVGKGSSEPSRLIVLEYQGAPDDQPPHVLVGKGITFDTGGISIKPSANMDEMRYDMGGAASVMGTFKTLLEVKPAINVVGIIASAENMPDGNALKPGDVITTLKGLTVEVLNTDAEGRLVLCDALTYAERFKPASVVDMATLTGAMVIALGGEASGVFSNDDGLAEELLEAADESWDRAWQLPIWDEYQKLLESNFADLANIGGRGAGAITAACFLSRFASDYRWAHLDIAGTAWDGKKGATGRPVGLLTQYLFDREAEGLDADQLGPLEEV
ncbi:leucyl aminopeptidase [Carnimonas nigrificans]|uniref:leucyl aminopeptidase n=1 Tax=Carnimonas nigrificans TaxID=64323 RepID=UPI00046FD38F|nr:leucyl aminopeptidase [Carnimonas nigrificans]